MRTSVWAETAQVQYETAHCAAFSVPLASPPDFKIRHLSRRAVMVESI